MNILSGIPLAVQAQCVDYSAEGLSSCSEQGNYAKLLEGAPTGMGKGEQSSV